MAKTIIAQDAPPKHWPDSQAVRVGDFHFLSVKSPSIRHRELWLNPCGSGAQNFKNIEAVLKAAGADFAAW
jgi:enamine deaminase RidA (YjgF/YER057c/UK114 family)